MKKQIRNRVMVLITAAQYEKLLRNYHNMVPVVKLFSGPLTWLVTGIETNLLYGYSDMGHGFVNWGYLCHETELPLLKYNGCYLKRDRHWEHKTGTDYLSLDNLIGV